MKALFLALLSLALLLPNAGRGASAGESSRATPVNVILWFDTEDYILPASDDAAKRLCEILSQRGIRATFKIVGEKARVLESRKRKDVIAALKKHDIAYHTDFHSVHPTPTEYLADCGWLDGVAEFIRREGAGAADVRRIFGVKELACYGQPGSSWAPQAIAALKQIKVAPHGVPCYVDEGTHVGLNGEPFWYAGALNVYHLSPNYTRMELHDPAEVEPGKREVSAIAERLAKKGGGLISIFYHPCEWVHREFWDGVNFKRGANPAREEWKVPPQRTAAETEAAFRRFAEYIDHIRSIPGVRWVTASDLPLLYPDLVRTAGASEQDFFELSAKLGKKPEVLDIVRTGQRAYSAADQFELLTVCVNEWLGGKEVKFPLKLTGLFGPDAPGSAQGRSEGVPWLAFRDAAIDVHQFIKREGRVPARVFIGADAVAPADFLSGLAWVANYYHQHHRLPAGETVPLGHLKLGPERFVAADTPGLFGGWIIHQADFRAPHLMQLARLQAWTLKPAIPAQAAQ